MNKKPSLHNVISRSELLERVKRLPAYETASFYKYFSVQNCEELRNTLYLRLSNLKVLGRIYVSVEGVNAQLSYPSGSKQQVLEAMEGTGLEGCLLNVGVQNDNHSFYRLVVKVRKKIVDDGMPLIPLEKRGFALDAEDFNRKMDEGKTVVLDVRNIYEYEIGHFENAIGFSTDFFRDQLPAIEEKVRKIRPKQILMYCTGGIRCEKASAYLVDKGFQNVYMLHGGIINYAKTVKENKLENKFVGKNFTFDMRLGESITDDIVSCCHQCGEKSNTHVNCRNILCNLLFLQCEKCNGKFAGCCSALCKRICALPKDEQKKFQHKFTGNGKKNIYNAYRTGDLKLLETG